MNEENEISNIYSKFQDHTSNSFFKIAILSFLKIDWILANNPQNNRNQRNKYNLWIFVGRDIDPYPMSYLILKFVLWRFWNR